MDSAFPYPQRVLVGGEGSTWALLNADLVILSKGSAGLSPCTTWLLRQREDPAAEDVTLQRERRCSLAYWKSAFYFAGHGKNTIANTMK